MALGFTFIAHGASQRSAFTATLPHRASSAPVTLRHREFIAQRSTQRGARGFADAPPAEPHSFSRLKAEAAPPTRAMSKAADFTFGAREYLLGRHATSLGALGILRQRVGA